VGPRPFRIRLSHMWIAAAILASGFAEAGSVGGDVTYTSDYIFRGISESDGRGAAQVDLHATTNGGTFIGVFASTLGEINDRGWDYEVETYLGHRFDLSPSWSATVSAVNYAYIRGDVPFSNDYQELSIAVSYLDQWTLSVAAAPNAVRYVARYRLGRYAAYVTDASGQLPLVGRFFATGGVGYYSLEGPDGTGYAYGNIGVAFEYKALRIDAGFYVTQARAQELFPYGQASNRVAGTISWHF
jgi:uncharacterized protein (TIGR02001 family)